MNFWLVKFILCVALTVLPARAATLVTPNPLIAPAEVVAIQMTSLKHNDLDEPDFGIRQTWAFAHPQNRRLTGPLPRFATMLKGPAFSPLLNHRAHQIKPAETNPAGQHASGAAWRKFDVLVETAQGDILYLSWVVQQVVDGPLQDCWMTVGVSAPQLVGKSG